MKKQIIKNNILKNKSFLGHKIEKNLGMRGVHPSMAYYLAGARKNISVIEITFSIKYLVKTLYILFSIIRKKGHILVINTNPNFSNLINTFALKTANLRDSFSFCNSKWVGGTLTNWNQISKSIKTFIKFSQRFGLFITQNNIHFPRYKKLKKSFQNFIPKPSSQVKLKKPDILFITNPNDNQIVLLEARQLNIPVIALTDTNSNLSFITYPIPVNNNSIFIIHFYFSWIIRLLYIANKKK